MLADYVDYGNPLPESQQSTTPADFRRFLASQGFLEYHKSWDWLMQVAHKVNSEGIDNYGQPGFVVYGHAYTYVDVDGDQKFVQNNTTKEDRDPLEMAWCTLVDFVKWRNSLPPNQY